MRLLLDTHAFLWWLEGNPRLSTPAQAGIADMANRVLVSAASAWEITTKLRIGKLPGAAAVAEDVEGCLATQGFESLAIAISDGARAGGLVGAHRDPFDRMLIAQALRHDLVLVSNEALFETTACGGCGDRSRLPLPSQVFGPRSGGGHGSAPFRPATGYGRITLNPPFAQRQAQRGLADVRA